MVTVTACAGSGTNSGGAADDGSLPGASMSIPTTTTESQVIAATTAPLASEPTVPADARERCIEAVRVLDRRIEDESFEFPDEGPELSEEELEQALTPAFEVADGVAAPDERPPLASMPSYDPETIPIVELDVLVGSCFEFAMITDSDLD